MGSNGHSQLPFRQAEPVWSQGSPTLAMPSGVVWSQPRSADYGVPSPNSQVSKPLALEFEKAGGHNRKEALLDEYVRGFRAAQGQIAQTIPQPQQPPYTQTLTKDRVDDFAKNAGHTPSAFRRVIPRQGGVAAPAPVSPSSGSGDHQQGPSAAELERALDLSLDPAPRLSMLAARFEGQQQHQAIMPQATKVDISESLRSPTGTFPAHKGSSELCFRGSHVEGLGSDWKRSAFEMLRAPPQREAKPVVPQEIVHECMSQREEIRVGQQKSAEAVEKPMSSKWCGSLNAEAWPTPPKRKRAQEEAIDMNELPALLRWMESLEGQGLRGHGGGGKDQVLECLEEMLGFRRKGGDREAVRKQDVSHLQEVAQVSQQGGVAREEVRTVPLGRRWEEECIRGVLETIIRQGAARRGGEQQRMQAEEGPPLKRAKLPASKPLQASEAELSPRASFGTKAEARHADDFGIATETCRAEDFEAPRSASGNADIIKPASGDADIIMRAQLQQKEHALAASQHAMEALKQQMARLHQGSINLAQMDVGANGHDHISRKPAAESGDKPLGVEGFGLSPVTPQGEGDKIRSSLKEEKDLLVGLPRPENRLEETS